MDVRNCVPPKCHFITQRKKCVRPNSYIETISWCKRNNIDLKKCKDMYRTNKKEAQDLSCTRYEERKNFVVVKPPKICPEGKIINPLTGRCIKERIKKKNKKHKPIISSEHLKSVSRISSEHHKSIKSPKNLKSISRISQEHPKSISRISKESLESISRKSPEHHKSISRKSLNQLELMSRKSLYNMFVPATIEKKNAVYFKKNKKNIVNGEKNIERDALIKECKRKIRIKHKIFLKDIFDDKKTNQINNLSDKRDLKEQHAAKKIKSVLVDKIVSRLQTIKGRISYYNYIQKYLKDTQKKNCLVEKKFVDKDGKEQKGFEIDNIIKLVKKIGTNSLYGVIYKTYIKKSLIFLVSKIMPMNTDNKKEIMINNLVSDLVKNHKSKHFLMTYKTFECHKAVHDDSVPKIIHRKKYFISLNELAHGDMTNICTNEIMLSKNNVMLNIALQCLLSIATFHSLGYTHNDCHWGNFLFHETKEDNGYFKYSINNNEYYLKNCGYNIMINDFGFAIKMDSSHQTKSRIVEDYRKILNSFMTATDRGWAKNEPSSYNVVSLFIKKLSDKILKHLFNYDDEALIVNTIIQEFLKFPRQTMLYENNLPDSKHILNRHAFTIKTVKLI